MINLEHKSQWSNGETFVSFTLLLRITNELEFYQPSLFSRGRQESNLSNKNTSMRTIQPSMLSLTRTPQYNLGRKCDSSNYLEYEAS